MAPIEWYSHDDDGHTVFHQYYRMPGENYYGFDPPEEPDPIGECAWCGKPIYNEDYIYDFDVICPECEEYAYRGATAVDYIIHLLKDGQVGSVRAFLEDNRCSDWTEPFGAFVRCYFEEDYDKWVKF